MEAATEEKVRIPCQGAIHRGMCRADCCGPVPFPVQAYRKLRDRAYQEPEIEIPSENREFIFPIASDLKCVFLNRATLKCQIYSDRPDVCRKYGTMEELPCPCFKISGILRTRAERRAMRRKIGKAMKAMAQRHLKRAVRKI